MVEEKGKEVLKSAEKSGTDKKEVKRKPSSKAPAQKKAPAKGTEEILKSIESLSVLELVDLVKALEERFGVSAALPLAAVTPEASSRAAPPEEKTTFDVILKEIGSQKIQVIKVVRSLTDLGLKEAKALVDEAPKPVKTGMTKEEAEEIKKKLEEVGAKVELK